MKVLVIEDEILAQEELVRILLKHFPDTDIAGTISSVRDAVEWLGKNTASGDFHDRLRPVCLEGIQGKQR